LKHALLLALCAISSAWAQSAAGGGTISGTVKDSTGAAIPTAKIAITHIDTGRVFNAVANEEGYFAAPSLSIGKYRLRAESPGMKVWTGELQLETGKTVEVPVSMVPGSVSETVEVTATIPLVTTTDPTDASTLDSQRIKELPINGRDLNTLLGQTAPGIEQIIDVNGGVRAGGLMGYSTSYTQDGAASNNREFGGSMNLQGLESIGEVRVETSTSSARYNTPTSIIVNTKSGTNKFKGSLYETARNNAFGVAKARQDISFNADNPYRTPKLIRNEFGGSIGGPMVIPKLYNGKDRTFFFLSREQVELRQGLTRDWAVPTMAMRGGDFSQLYDNQNRFITLYDPQTTRYQTRETDGASIAVREPFPGNKIPQQRMSPLARYVWGITPIPTDITNPVITTNLKLAVPTNGFPNLSDNPTTIKVDHNISERDRFFIKANGGRRFTNFLGTASGNGAPTTNREANVTYLPMQAVAGAASWNHTFSPRLFAETLVAQTWQSTKTITGAADAQNNWSKELGLPNPYGEIGWPALTSLSFMPYREGDNRRALTSRILSVQQNYTYIRKTHKMEFGVSMFSEKQHLLPDQGDISGTATFNSGATALQNPASAATNPQALQLTGYDAANFYLGHAAVYTVGLKRNYLRLTNRTFGSFIQDSYKVSKRLMLTPGLRWDINPAMSEENFQLNGFDRASHSLILPQPLDYYYKGGFTTPEVVKVFQNVGVTFKTAEELGVRQNLFPNNLFDIGPRMGFVYTAFDGNKQMVVRGGYGLYISAIPMRTLLAQFSGQLPFRATITRDFNAAARTEDGLNNFLVRNVPTIVAGANSANAVNLNQPNPVGRGQQVTGIDPNFPNLKIHEWNLTVEKQLTNTTVFRLRYNGKHGVNSDQIFDINPQQTDWNWYSTRLAPLPTGTFSAVARRPYDQNAYTGVRFLTKTGYINTESFAVEMERRFRKGLGFQGFYTLTNSLRLAGNSFRDGLGAVPEAYQPGSVPTDLVELNRFLNYTRDSAVPKHRVRWNFSFDMPFGKKQHFGSNANKFLNALIGGWKMAGSGTIVSSWYALPANQWGEFGDIKVYGKTQRITDCRATPATATNQRDERCFEGYLFFNGYISERFINSVNAAGLRNGVYGLPDDYKPVQKPVNPWPKGGKTGDPGSTLWDTNTVTLTLTNGARQQVTPDTGLHPFRNQFRLGPFNWSQDASILKFFNLTEGGVRLRVNFDVFNVFNTQGLVTPAANGISSLQNSYGGFGMRPRQVQINARLEF